MFMYKHSYYSIFVILFLGISSTLWAQNVGINTSGTTPDPSALLDLNTGNTFTPAGAGAGKGLLIPTVPLSGVGDATSITSPATSLLVYVPSGSGLTPAGYWYNSGTSGSPTWTLLATGGQDWHLTGNSGTTASTAAIGSIVNNNFIGTTDANDFVFASNNLERMRIASGGNVGIGTTIPAYKLDLWDPLDVGPRFAGNWGTGGQMGLTLAAGDASMTDATASKWGLVIGGKTRGDAMIGAFEINEQTNSSPGTRLFIKSGGNIGIGTTTPAYLLEADGDIYANGGWFRVSGNNGIYWQSLGPGWYCQDASWLRTYPNGGSTGIWANNGTIATNGSFEAGYGGAAGPAGGAIFSGYVGIATSSPGYPLDVETTLWTDFSSITNGRWLPASAGTTVSSLAVTLLSSNVSIFATGSIWGHQIISSSDRRAKENIVSRNSAEALSLINKLNPVKYNWIDPTISHQPFEDGFIAQEVEKVLPEVVSVNKEVIPNIMEMVEHPVLIDNTLKFTIKKEVEIHEGDILKIITEENGENKFTVASVNNHDITLNVDSKFKLAEKIFVYGKEVKDFRTVEYNKIFTVGISAIQELSKKMDQQGELISRQQQTIDSLMLANQSLQAKDENRKLKATVDSLENFSKSQANNIEVLKQTEFDNAQMRAKDEADIAALSVMLNSIKQLQPDNEKPQKTEELTSK